MTLSRIEQVLFHDPIAHYIEAFDVLSGTLIIHVIPYLVLESPNLRTELTKVAHFHDCKIISVDYSHADPDTPYPWDIIGFEAEALPENRWQFSLYCNAAHYIFEAQWPALSVAT